MFSIRAIPSLGEVLGDRICDSAILHIKRSSSVYRSNRGRLPKRCLLTDAVHAVIDNNDILTELLRLLPTPFSLSTMSSPYLQLIRNALDNYAEQMKIDINDNPFAEQVKNCETPGAVLQLLEKNRDEFKEYRDKNRKFIDCVNPVVKFVHAFSGILNEAASLVSRERSSRSPCFFFQLFPRPIPFHPAKLIFVGINVLFTVCTLFHFVPAGHLPLISRPGGRRSQREL